MMVKCEWDDQIDWVWWQCLFMWMVCTEETPSIKSSCAAAHAKAVDTEYDNGGLEWCWSVDWYLARWRPWIRGMKHFYQVIYWVISWLFHCILHWNAICLMWPLDRSKRSNVCHWIYGKSSLCIVLTHYGLCDFVWFLVMETTIKNIRDRVTDRGVWIQHFVISFSSRLLGIYLMCLGVILIYIMLCSFIQFVEWMIFVFACDWSYGLLTENHLHTATREQT